MGSRSRSEQTSSTSSTVNQDIFGISDIGSGAIAAGGSVSNTEILDYSTRVEDNSDRSTEFNSFVDSRDMSDRSQRTNIQANDNSDRSQRTNIQANDSSNRSISNSGNTMIEGDRNRTSNLFDARDFSDQSTRISSRSDSRDMSDRSITSTSDSRDLSDRSTRISSTSDSRDLSDRSVRIFNDIDSADPEIVLGALEAVENVAGFALAENSVVNLAALAANTTVASRAISASENIGVRSVQAIERGVAELGGAFGDLGYLTLQLAREDAIQTDRLLSAGAAQTAAVVAANKTETAQGFDRLTETIVTLGGVAAAAYILGA